MKINFFLILGIACMLLAACQGRSSVSSRDEVKLAPEFSLPNSLGGEVALSDFAGQPVLLFFHMAVD